jgi:hypothetical protein
MNESDYRWVDDPTVANSANESVTAWADQSRKDIFVQVFGRDGAPLLSVPTNVSRSPDTFSWLPRVAVSGDGKSIAVLWQEIIFSGGSHGGEILFAASSDGGSNFEKPRNLSNSIAGDGKGRLSRHVWDNGSLDLARAPNGELYAAWTEYEGALWFRRTEDEGRRFVPALQLAGTTQAPARGPTIAVGPKNAVHIAWAVGEIPSADIQIASSADGGRSFSAAQAVSHSETHSDAPQIAADGRGNVHLVHAEEDSGRDGSYHVRYSRLSAGATRFDAPRRIEGEGDEASARYPHVGVDARANVYVLFERYSEGQVRPSELAISHSPDGGESFRAPVVLSEISGPSRGFNGSQQGLLMSKLHVTPDGGIAVVNSTFRPEARSVIWLLRGRPAAAGR